MDMIKNQVHGDQYEHADDQTNYESEILSRYVSTKKQRTQGYFYENTCCILRWTNIGKKCFYSIKDLNEWIKTNPDEYATCTYLYIYERSYDFISYFPPHLQLLDVRFSKVTYNNLPQFPSFLRSIHFFKCSQLLSFDILDCVDKCPHLEELILYACGINQIYFPLLETQNIQNIQINEEGNRDRDRRLEHENMRLIELSYNHLTSIDIPNQIPTNVSILHLDHNMLTSVIFPELGNEMSINLQGNEVQFNNVRQPVHENLNIPWNNPEYVYRNTNFKEQVIYEKGQNVHSSSIQDSSNNSVQILDELYQLKLATLNESSNHSVQNSKKIKESWKTILASFCHFDLKICKKSMDNSSKVSEWENTEWEKNAIAYFKDRTITNMIRNADDTIVHSIHSITMKEIIKRVWTIIALETDQEKKKEMAKVFKDEMYHGRGLCFTGRFTRVVNCLCGFVEGITIEISPIERLQAQISAFYKTLSEKDDAGVDSDDENILHKLFDMLKDADLLNIGDFEKNAWPWIELFCETLISDKKKKEKHYVKSLAKKYVESHI